MVPLELSPRKLSHESSVRSIRSGWDDLVLSGITKTKDGFVKISSSDTYLHYSFNGYMASTLVYGGNGAAFSLRDYRFYDDPHLEGVISIRSDSKTKQHYESNGFGSGLILLSNEVIEETIGNNSQFDGKIIVAGILDTSRGQSVDSTGNPINRKNWTSFYARELGYSYNDTTRMWHKVYRGNIPDQELRNVYNFGA